MSKLLLVLAISLLVSCSDDKEKSVHDKTLLVYLGRDNDLDSASEDKREEIIGGWNGKGGKLIIYQDLPGGAKLEEIFMEKKQAKSRVLYEYGQENSADPNVFSRVIKEVVSEFPSESYGLIVFSHATGWLPDNSYASLRSIIKDNNEWMSLPDFASSIPDGLFDYIVLETCLMGGVEVAYELKDKTKYILCSPAEILSPGFKDVYRTSVNKLFYPEDGLISFANDVFTSQEGMYFSSATITLIDTSGLEDLAQFIKSGIENVEFPEIDSIQYFDRKGGVFFDFEQHYARLLENDSARKELSRLIGNCIVKKFRTPDFLINHGGFHINHYSGMTTYIPQEKYPYLNDEYKKTKWAQAIGE